MKLNRILFLRTSHLVPTAPPTLIDVNEHRSNNQNFMADNCDEMFLRLQQSGYLQSVKSRKYEEEDHGSVIAAALNGAIFYFLDHLRRL
jgi:predicted alpha/beta superfamily hydrolase